MAETAMTNWAGDWASTTGTVSTGTWTPEYHTGDFWPVPYTVAPYWGWWQTYPVYVYPPTPVLGCSIEHDYRKLDPARLFCRKCGETKRVK